jgi:hypothetical protein
MNVQIIGPIKRPKLSLSYGSTQAAAAARGPATIPDHELRRIVAGMIG